MLCNQAKKSVSMLWINLAKYGELPPHVYLRLFHVSIVPILCYGSEVWGYMEGRSHQIVLNKFCKRILGVKCSTPNCAVAGELGQYPLSLIRQVNIVRYWCKLVSGPRERYRYIVYKYLCTFIDAILPRGYRNWAKEVRDVLVRVGYVNVWSTEQLPCDSVSFVNIVKQTLIDLYITEWSVQVRMKEKLITFGLFKVTFGFEMYLYLINSPIIRKTFSRFRLSSHTLEIERGRYPPRRPRLQRLCRQCDMNVLEDEYHLIMMCDKYTGLRQIYIDPYYYQV